LRRRLTGETDQQDYDVDRPERRHPSAHHLTSMGQSYSDHHLTHMTMMLHFLP
jgi:hypothetical protein